MGISPDARGRRHLELCRRSFSISRMSLRIYTIEDNKEKQIKPKTTLIINEALKRLEAKKSGIKMRIFFIQWRTRSNWNNFFILVIEFIICHPSMPVSNQFMKQIVKYRICVLLISITT